MFSFPFLAGDRSSALDDPSGVVITPLTAERAFGLGDEPEKTIGKTLTVWAQERTQTFTVTGVVTVPSTSSMFFRFVIPYANEGYYDYAWAGGQTATIYVRVPAEKGVRRVEAVLDAYKEQVAGDRIARWKRLRRLDAVM